MKVTYDGAGVRKIAEDAIRKAVQAKDDPADLINVALEELVRARCELPGYTTLDVMAAAIRAEVNNGFCQTVAGRLDPAAKARLARMLAVDPVSRRSEFDRVKDVAKAASLAGSRSAWTSWRASTRSARPRCGWTECRRGRSLISPGRRGSPTPPT